MARNKKKPEVLLQEGQLLGNGKYRIVKCLASSDYSITYEALVTAFKTRCIVKELFYKELNDRDFGSPYIKVNGDEQDKALFAHQKKIFINEARRMSSVRNDHLVPIQDAFEDNGTAYQVVNYLEGQTLEELLESNGSPLDEERAADILRQCLTALQSLHNFGLLHLDIKPGNIFITKDGQAKLINFGVWRMMPDIDTVLKLPSGYTLRYSPDEIVEKKQDRWGAYTDLYSLGATTYAMLSGKIPPKTGDIMEDGEKAFDFPAGIRPAMRELVMWMMTPRRKGRPQSVAAVMKKLNELPPVEQAAPAPEPAPEPEPTPAPEPVAQAQAYTPAPSQPAYNAPASQAPVYTPTPSQPAYNAPVSQAPVYTPTPSQPAYNAPVSQAQPYTPAPSQPGYMPAAQPAAYNGAYDDIDGKTQIAAPRAAASMPNAYEPYAGQAYGGQYEPYNEPYNEEAYEEPYDEPKKSNLPLILIIAGAAVVTTIVIIGLFMWLGGDDYSSSVDDDSQTESITNGFSVRNGLTTTEGINANAFYYNEVRDINFTINNANSSMVDVTASFVVTRTNAYSSSTTGATKLVISGNDSDNRNVYFELRPDSRTEINYSDALRRHGGYRINMTFSGSVSRRDLEKVNNRRTSNTLVLN